MTCKSLCHNPSKLPFASRNTRRFFSTSNTNQLIWNNSQKIISKKNQRAEQVERVSLQNKRMMGSNFIEKPNTQQKNKDAPRVTHNAWSNKNIAHWKMTWCFCWWSGDALGIPKLWRLYLLDISWGDHGGIPKLELLSILHLIASFFSPYTWKLPSHKTHHNSH